MRVLAISLLLASALLAVVPAANAQPVPPRCAEQDIAPGLSLNENCGVTAEYDLMDCFIDGSWKEYRVGNNVVRVYTCDAPR